MAQIADNPEPGHLIHYLSSESSQPRVPQLRVPSAAVVLRVVRQLHLSDTEVAEDAQVGQLVLDASCVLPAQQYGGAAGLLGTADIGDSVRLHDQVRVLLEPLLPLDDIGKAPPETLPEPAGARHTSDAAGVPGLEDFARKVGYVEAIEVDRGLASVSVGMLGLRDGSQTCVCDIV
ncbi:unnamed protein product [Clonostachys rosea f. rosea IK726]|uniref:Uncharacterized protein n=1 Tax=Clonostachys rosea f. rosea IK726 TaxID=1349383 RepID=A0ACA9UH79_BIOOC|nr:unnamed protein product [Clonostachys rosea f. rosea IK726]